MRVQKIDSQPLGAADYLQLSQAFHTILIRDVPQMSLQIKSQARRFITLIDTLYDNKVSKKYDTIKYQFYY
jgi:protein AFG1